MAVERFREAVAEFRAVLLEAVTPIVTPLLNWLTWLLDGPNVTTWGEGPRFDCETCGPAVPLEGERCLSCGADSVTVKSTVLWPSPQPRKVEARTDHGTRNRIKMRNS